MPIAAFHGNVIVLLNDSRSRAVWGYCVKVLIVDDHPIVLSGCRTLLVSESEIEVFAAENGEAAYEAFLTEQPAVAVIDFNLPTISGLELLRRLLIRDPAARVIMFSMVSEAAFAAQAIAAGARGFVSKIEAVDTLAAAIRHVAKGGIYLSADLARRVALLRLTPRREEIGDFTTREREIVRLLADGRSLSEIANLINLSYKTVATSAATLRSKLNARTPMELVRIAVLLGLC